MRLHGQERALCAVTALVCWLVACSHGSDSAQAAANLTPIDPCSVLTSSDIQAALGAAPKAAGARDNETVIDKCTWTLPSGADVALTFYNAANPALAATLTPQLSSRRPDDKTYEPVNGLGDQAVYRDDARPPVITVSKTVEVVKGKRHFDIQYVDSYGKTAGPSKDAMVSLTRTALAHID